MATINLDSLNRAQLRKLYRETLGAPADRRTLDRSTEMREQLAAHFAAQVAPTPPKRVRISLADLVEWVAAHVGQTVEIPEEGLSGLPKSAQSYPAYWTSHNNNGTNAAKQVGVKVTLSKANRTIQVSEIAS